MVTDQYNRAVINHAIALTDAVARLGPFTKITVVASGATGSIDVTEPYMRLVESISESAAQCHDWRDAD